MKKVSNIFLLNFKIIKVKHFFLEINNDDDNNSFEEKDLEEDQRKKIGSSSTEKVQEKSIISQEPINDDEEKSNAEIEQNDNIKRASNNLNNGSKQIAGHGRSQRNVKHLEPGPSNDNTCFRPAFHHHYRGGPFRQNNYRMNINSIPSRFPMSNFPLDPRSTNPSFFGFRPNRFPNNFPQGPRPPLRFFKPNEIRGGPRLMNPMPHFLPRSPLISSNTNFQASNMPQKVLINPNFKGGVEAVKS